MHFKIKNTLKNNRNHTPKQTLNLLSYINTRFLHG